MPIIVTLDIFSGRQNPSWELTNEQILILKEKIYSLRGRSLLKASVLQLGPGYTGYTIECLNDPDLPLEIKVCSGIVDMGWDLESIIDPNNEVENWLLETSSNVLNKTLYSYAHQDIISERNNINFVIDNIYKHRLIEPSFDPSWWNGDKKRRLNNNCYNYCCNIATNTFAQPGLASGTLFGSHSCIDIFHGTIRDGLKPITKLDDLPSVGHIAALSVAPDLDFHWYRRDDNFLWSHKPGRNPVINIDLNGDLITDPRIANRGNYTSFCGFFHVAPDSISII